MLERLAEERLLGDGFGAGVEGRDPQFLERFDHQYGTSPQRIETQSRVPSRSTTTSIGSVGQTL